MRKLTDPGRNCCVYKVTNKDTGRCYIGISVRPERRWRRPYAAHFGNALAKHGRDAFDWEIILELPSYREAQIAEMCLIYVLDPSYNATIGGDGRCGFNHTLETRAKMSATRSGRPNPKLLGRKQTPEHVRNAAAARTGKPSPMKGRKLTPEQIAKRLGKTSPLCGVKHSTEHRRKNSVAHLGKTHSPETRAKMSESHKKRRRAA